MRTCDRQPRCPAQPRRPKRSSAVRHTPPPLCHRLAQSMETATFPHRMHRWQARPTRLQALRTCLQGLRTTPLVQATTAWLGAQANTQAEAGVPHQISALHLGMPQVAGLLRMQPLLVRRPGIRPWWPLNMHLQDMSPQAQQEQTCRTQRLATAKRQQAPSASSL